MERAAGRERGDLIEGHERTPQHDRVAEIVDAATARPSGQLRVLAGREERMVIAGELRQLLDHHRPRRHVDTDRQRLGGEHHLHETLREAGFDDLLERRHHARVVSSDPGLQLREELPVAEDSEIVLLHPGQPALDDLADADALVDARQLHAGSQARLRRFGARVAAEDEVDRRQHVLGVEAFDDLEPRWRVQLAPDPAPALATLPLPHRLVVEPGRLRVRTAPDDGRQQVQPFRRPITDQVEVVEPDRSFVLDDGDGLAPHGRDPGCELVSVRHRGGQADETNLRWQVDDDLLPHGASVGVLEEVDLVEDDKSKVVQRPGAGVDHVAEHLGRHHDRRRVAVDRVVAGQEPDRARAMDAAQVLELLVRQGLDRSGVERTFAVGQRGGDGVLGHHRLARSGRCRHQDRRAAVERIDRLDLEPIQREGVVGDQLAPVRAHPHSVPR